MRRPYFVKSSTAGAFRCPKDDAILRLIVSLGMMLGLAALPAQRSSEDEPASTSRSATDQAASPTSQARRDAQAHQARQALSPQELQAHPILSRPVRMAPGLVRQVRASNLTLSEPTAYVSLSSDEGPGWVPRAMGSSLVGGLAALGGAALGGGAAWRVSRAKLGQGSPFERLIVAAGAYAGGVLTAPVGVWGGAKLAQGRGGLMATYAGGLLGTAAAWSYARRPEVSTQRAYGALLIGPMLGAMAGYELSHALSSPERGVMPSMALTVEPRQGGGLAAVGWTW